MFSSEFCEIFKKTFFKEYLRTSASEGSPLRSSALSGSRFQT